MRDEIDQRIINDINTTSGSIIDSQEDVGGFPNWPSIILSDSELNTYDADKDGTPTDWELVNNLNPNYADDRNVDSDNDGYTNFEEYLNTPQNK